VRNRVLTFLVALLTLTLPLAAETIYSYTGNPFGVASGPYTASDRVTGSFDVSSPLAPNLNNALITPDSFSFTDGIQLANETLIPHGRFFISTDATGDISDWVIGWFLPDQGFIYTNNLYRDAGQTPPPNVFVDFNQFDPGTWTSQTITPEVVPEPESLLLAATGVMSTLAIRRRFWQFRRA
jgi:hypothetical protein